MNERKERGMSIPSISHPTDRPNFTIVTVGGTQFAFSYETVVGFVKPGDTSWTVSENDWGPTTGKHLNHLDFGRGQRLPREEFEARLEALLT